MNAGKSKVLIFERKEVEVVNFGNQYRVSVPVCDMCERVMGGEKMEVVKEFKYLGAVLSKHGEMEEVRERTVKGRSVIGSLGRVMKGRNVSMEAKRGLRNSVLLPTLTCGSGTWAWNRAQQSRVRAVEMSYLRGACGVTRWDGESNESVYEMGSEEFVKKVCMIEIESVGPNSRGRPPVRWRDRVKEYMCERGATRGGGLNQAKRECMDRERWRFFCCGHPLRGRSWRGRGVRAIDR